MADQKIEKWLSWGRVMHDDIQELLIAEHILWDIQKLVRRNKKLREPSAYYKYMAESPQGCEHQVGLKL